MKLTKETREEIKQYCLDAINSDDTTFKNDTERVQYAYTRFKSDYYNYDNSDSQSDYFDVNFYLNIGIGRYDKPFKEVV